MAEQSEWYPRVKWILFVLILILLIVGLITYIIAVVVASNMDTESEGAKQRKSAIIVNSIIGAIILVVVCVIGLYATFAENKCLLFSFAITVTIWTALVIIIDIIIYHYFGLLGMMFLLLAVTIFAWIFWSMMKSRPFSIQHNVIYVKEDSKEKA